MRIGKSHRSADSPIVGPLSGITRENFVERARAFVGARGGAAFVIRGVDGPKGSAHSRQAATEPQWLAWLAYLGRLGVPARAMRARGEATVPSEWPEDFDASWPLSDRGARIYAAPKAVDFDRKATVQAAARRFATWGAKPKREGQAPRAEDWLREYGSQPLSVSDALRERMIQ